MLSLDGGGIRGAFAASVLACLEEDQNEPINRYFDLIVGTSTGGILALALALGIPAARIVSFYQIYGPKIFARGRVPGTIRQIFFGKYSPTDLVKALKEVFGDATIGDAKTRLLVPAFDVNSGKVLHLQDCP